MWVIVEECEDCAGQGKLYGYSSIKKCSLGEYIDLETYCKDMENSMHKVAAILYRPIISTTKEKYKRCKTKAE